MPNDKRFTPEYEVADACDIRLIAVPLAVVILLFVALAFILFR